MDEPAVAVRIRPYDKESDEAFIYATWRNSSYYGKPRAEREDPRPYYKRLSTYIRDILKSAEIRIACLDDDPFTVLGYSVSSNDHLDWIYVKHEFRLKGIGKLLLPKNIKTVTNDLTKIGEKIAQLKGFIVYRGLTGDIR